MKVAHIASRIFIVDPLTWAPDWVWGLTLIVVTVVIHVLGLGLIGRRMVAVSDPTIERRHPAVRFVVVVGAATLLATSMHATEAGIWAAAYRFLGALPDQRRAMLYSLNAITSYGHASVSLENQWELLGALEALNGWLLFGLTTAFLFAMIVKVWSLGNKEGQL
jgi:hypothetical protein